MSRNRTVLLGKILAGVVICLGLLLAVGTTPVWAQSAATGNIFGLVTDPSGAVVVDATVTITDSTTGEARTTQTNESGRYIITNLAPGKYDIAITKKGFAAARLSGQTVEVGKAGSLNFTLPVGATTEVVEVQANNVQLQTTNATVGNTITGISLEALPSLGRDVSSFVTLQPGVAPDGSVAGAVYDQNAFALDGGQNTNDMDGSMNIYTNSFAGDSTGGLVAYEVTGGATGSGGPTGVIPTPADSIEEFKVGTNNQTADFNSSAGAQVSMVTKRGTNSWHGTAYEYYLDNNFNANTWDNNNTGTPIPSYHYNRFGGAIGGPILPKMLGGKTYFFANYQGFRWPNSETVEVPRSERFDALGIADLRQLDLQPESDSGYVQRCHLRSDAVPRSLRSARPGNQSAGAADVEHDAAAQRSQLPSEPLRCQHCRDSKATWAYPRATTSALPAWITISATSGTS